MKRVLFLLICLALLSSCEKEIEFNGEQSDPKLVINSLVESGQPVSAAISKSFFFLDNAANTLAPDGLVATLYVNDNRIGEMSFHYDTLVSYDTWNPNESSLGRVQKVYTHEYCPAVGDVVKITASANGFEDVEGVTSPLPNAIVFQFDTEVTEWHGGYYFPYYDDGEYEEDSVWRASGILELTINITDPNPGKTDFFKLVTDKGNDHYDGNNWYYISFDYEDPIFGVGIDENEIVDISDLDTRPEGVFTDVLFDGNSYRLKLKVQFDCELAEECDPDFYHVPILLQHISKEYYNYLNTCDQGDMAVQLWAEPIQTYSNVTNGYGIVAGRTVDTLLLELPIEEP